MNKLQSGEYYERNNYCVDVSYFCGFLMSPSKTVSEFCIDDVTYVTTLSGITAKLDSKTSKIIKCTGDN